MMGTTEALIHLRKSLADPAPSVRYYACLTLGETGEASVIVDIAPYFDDPDADVREAVSEACARMPDAARPVLFRYLREGNTMQKITAATAVRKARDRPALPVLVITSYSIHYTKLYETGWTSTTSSRNIRSPRR